MECSGLQVLSLILIFIVVVLHVFGFSTSYWVMGKSAGHSEHSGLWRHCVCASETCVCISEKEISSLGFPESLGDC